MAGHHKEELHLKESMSAFCCIVGMLAMVAGMFLAIFAFSQHESTKPNSILFLTTGITFCLGLVLVSVSITCRFKPCCSKENLVAQEFPSQLDPAIPSTRITDGIPMDWKYYLQQESISTSAISHQDAIQPYHHNNTEVSGLIKPGLHKGSYS